MLSGLSPVVLVVDDAPSSLGMLCDTLEGEGYTVLVARDGDSALQRLELDEADAGWVGRWFHRRLLARRLRPVCQVTYDRTARIVSTAEGLVRLTLDDNLRATAVEAPVFVRDAGELFLAGRNILELKYRARVPAVFRRLIEEFALKPQTASKYRLATAAVREPERPASLELRTAGDAAAYV